MLCSARAWHQLAQQMGEQYLHLVVYASLLHYCSRAVILYCLNKDDVAHHQR